MEVWLPGPGCDRCDTVLPFGGCSWLFFYLKCFRDRLSHSTHALKCSKNYPTYPWNGLGAPVVRARGPRGLAGGLDWWDTFLAWNIP